jgi:hydrogenase maturation protease
LYGDDGVGLHVIRRLKQEIAMAKKVPVWNEDLDLEECCLSGLSLLDVVFGYDDLVIIDTIKKDNPEIGRVHVLDGKDLRAIPGPSPHYVSVPQMIEIGRASGLHVPAKIKVVAVEAKNIYDLGEELSQEMRSSIPAIIEKVKEVLEAMNRETARAK